MTRYTPRQNQSYANGQAADSPHAVPGAGLDVLVAMASMAAGVGQESTSKTWFWLVELRIHLGKVTQCHGAGFAMSPPGDLNLSITTAAPNGDTVDQFLAGMTGYVVVNRNLDRLAVSGQDGAMVDFLVNSLGMMADEPGAISDLSHWHERAHAITPAILPMTELLAKLAADTQCPGLGPMALAQALQGELHYIEHRSDLELIARDEAIAHMHLGANDNLPQPEVCSEPPVFEELGS